MFFQIIHSFRVIIKWSNFYKCTRRIRICNSIWKKCEKGYSEVNIPRIDWCNYQATKIYTFFKFCWDQNFTRISTLSGRDNFHFISGYSVFGKISWFTNSWRKLLLTRWAHMHIHMSQTYLMLLSWNMPFWRLQNILFTTWGSIGKLKLQYASQNWKENHWVSRNWFQCFWSFYLEWYWLWLLCFVK